ncbi:hypothetical protein FHS83_001908 [Rhizomicrobium palustre]|uniref:Probable membrane transporter protein n=1 Tax=Rhizomicrobium palustre TaxID=189966 RepID=A0A846N067_9PROT|nr:TSUP family transporter [Rhizomicrobium palustre]NIK88590.1 hypothetical protein [Rhizomicrobium palustre]
MVDPLQLAGLFVLALVAGTIDAMAGGGGLLTVPGLMATGIPPVSALATNKMQAIFSSLSATYHFWRAGKLHVRLLWRPALLSMFGAMCGAAYVSLIDPSLLKALVPFLLMAICGWLLLSADFGKEQRAPRFSFSTVALTLVPLVAAYDGFFGPGTGTFFALGLVALAGFSLDQATIQAKLYNLMSNFGALIFFLVKGHIVWPFALVMACGMVAGGQIGARMVLKHGTGLIKPLLIVTSLGMSVRLLWQNGTLASWWGIITG